MGKAKTPTTKKPAAAKKPAAKKSEAKKLAVIKASECSNVVQLSLIEDDTPLPAERVRMTRLPESWRPSEANIAYAVSKGLTEKQVFEQAEQFANYWLGRGKAMLDWNRVWQTWCINATTRFANRKPSYNDHYKPYSPII